MTGSASSSSGSGSSPDNKFSMLGVDWANLITARDHTAGIPYYCEIHLQIELTSPDVFDNLNSMLDRPVSSEPEGKARLQAIKDVLIAELKKKDRANESTIAIVNALMLR